MPGIPKRSVNALVVGSNEYSVELQYGLKCTMPRVITGGLVGSYNCSNIFVLGMLHISGKGEGGGMNPNSQIAGKYQSV